MIAIIDYKAGNLTSVEWAFAALGAASRITRDAAEIRAAERVVFPGVGAAGAAMRSLRESGLDAVIREVVRRGTPFLGICVGTQILFERSEEDGGVACLGLLPGEVRRFQPTSPRDKVPHMGWNQVRLVRAHALLDGIDTDSDFYFVHSYFPAPSDPRCVVGLTEHAGASFASIVARGNLLATQFHAEKSGRAGLRLLQNFTRWDGRAPDGDAC